MYEDKGEDDILLSCYPITAHSLPRIGNLPQHILRSYIAHANDPKANGKGSSIPLQPSSCSRNHDFGVWCISNNMPFWKKAESEEENCARVRFTQDKLLCDEAEVEVSNGWGNPRSVEH